MEITKHEMDAMKIKECKSCNIHADYTWSVCPECGQPMTERVVVEEPTEHQLIKRLESVV